MVHRHWIGQFLLYVYVAIVFLLHGANVLLCATSNDLLRQKQQGATQAAVSTHLTCCSWQLEAG